MKKRKVRWVGKKQRRSGSGMKKWKAVVLTVLGCLLVLGFGLAALLG
ncbi:MAG TPA: hypothetical protein IAC57_01115 [Candidatus Scatosoma pullistercoris]|uniref:Uncharacterized protein n=1 Tax=Candidatus Scatosoma pullistercoris TaxID=2840934 RepID=A0A9D1MDV6_9FIRM|nr:hypothetical protein [Candidatus Scatosoma pullistercoris]